MVPISVGGKNFGDRDRFDLNIITEPTDIVTSVLTRKHHPQPFDLLETKIYL